VPAAKGSPFIVKLQEFTVEWKGQSKPVGNTVLVRTVIVAHCGDRSNSDQEGVSEGSF
jgi:hypothetical protein